jgi:hypothetical protein
MCCLLLLLPPGDNDPVDVVAFVKPYYCEDYFMK